MNEIKYNYDEEADVLYVSFGRSEHVTGVELLPNLLLRLETGKETGAPPRAVGLTFISFARMMAHHRDRALTISLQHLRNLPDDLWQDVVAVVTGPCQRFSEDGTGGDASGSSFAGVESGVGWELCYGDHSLLCLLLMRERTPDERTVSESFHP
ncbi:unnamed protein product [marine sediment metagenome]|uniref:DUF2283 domain-containing protein n=1 Tax=marine sediment metagenome TaxID=412755 RepID=X0RSM7_9ZZZZ